jgi:hypothetical protein
MKLQELSLINDGLYHVSVLIDGKKYTFTLSSEFAYRQYKKLLRYRPGAALDVLKKWNVKEEI